MYGLIWRLLPGPWFVKFTFSLGLVAGIAALLWYVVFPWADPYMPFNDGAVEVEDSPADGGAQSAPGEDPGAGDGGDEEGIVGVDVPVGDDGS